MQNGRPPDHPDSFLLRSQNSAAAAAANPLFQRLFPNVALQQQQNVLPKTELTGQSSSSLPFHSLQSQNSPAASQSMHSKLLNTGNTSRPQTANFLPPQLPLTSANQQNWRLNQSPSTSASSHRFSNLMAGVSPAQTVNPEANPLASQKPATPRIGHQPDQVSTSGTPQPKRPISPSKFASIGELLKNSNEDIYEALKTYSSNDINDFGEFETIEEDLDPTELLNDEKAVRTQHRQEFIEYNIEFNRIASEVDILKRELQELISQQETLRKKKEALNREEHEVPQTSQMPADVLIEQITHENQLALNAFDLKRLEFKVEFAEEDDPDFLDIDVPNDAVDINESDLLSISQRPACYEPSEVVNFEEERARYLPLIKSLAQVLEGFYQERDERLEKYHEKFASHAKPWKIRQDKAERNTKKIHRDNKNREIYEKTFQDIKKAREEKERTARSEKRPNAKQEAALAKARDEEKKKVFGSAIIPPMMQSPLMVDQPRGKIIENPMLDSLQSLNRFVKSWTDYEKGMYQKKFAQYGKNFPAIASCLGTKSTNDCIRYYYLTKQNVKYKQLHKMKKKKAGKQYKPTVVPTDGERMAERIRQFPFMRSNKYVECLICEKQMPVYLVPKLVKGMQVTGEFEETIKDELPICDSCNTHIRKAKAANFSKCPLAGCSLGRRRTKPNRTIPETANTLDLEKRRFIIHRRKLHPEAVKCCGSCIRKIQNDFADLATGKLDDEIKQFIKNREEKKVRKENENIPSWRPSELAKLVDAVKLHGISNWYEIASTMGIPNKTPFWCYEKYKELQASGEWDKMVRSEAPVDIIEQLNPAANESVKYICDLIDTIVLKEMEEVVKVKQEVPSPSDSPAPSGDESEEVPPQSCDPGPFNKREIDILRFEYLNMVKSYIEENPESPLAIEPVFIAEEEAIRESLSKENMPEPMEEDDDIQVLEVKPPPQKSGSTVGSLTQGTPRSGAEALSFPPTTGAELSFDEKIQNFQRSQKEELLSRKPSSVNTAVSTAANLIPAESVKNEFLISNVINAIASTSANQGIPGASITSIETSGANAGGVVNFFLSEFQKDPKLNAPPNDIHVSVPPNITFTDSFEHGKEKVQGQTVESVLERFHSGGLPFLNSAATSSNTQIEPINQSLLVNSNVASNASYISSIFNNIPTTSMITTQQPLGLKQIFKDGQPSQLAESVSGHATPSPAAGKSGEPERPLTADPIKRKSGVANAMLPHSHTGVKGMNIKRSYSPVISHPQDPENPLLEDEASLFNKETGLGIPSIEFSLLADSKSLLSSPQKIAELAALSAKELGESVSSSVQKSGTLTVKQEPREQDENLLQEQQARRSPSPKNAAFSHLRFRWESPRPPPDSSRVPLSPPEHGARRGSPASDVFIHRHLHEEIERPQSHGAVPKMTSDIEQPEIDVDSSQKMDDPLGLGESALSPAEDVYEYVAKINSERRKADAEEAKKRLDEALSRQEDDAVVIDGALSSDILSLDDESGTKKKKDITQEKVKTVEEIVNETVAKINQEVQEKQKRNKIGDKLDSASLTPKVIKTEKSDENSKEQSAPNDHATMRQLSPKTIQTDLVDPRYPSKYAKNDYQNAYNSLSIITDDPTITLGAPTTSAKQDNLLAAFEGLPPADVKRKRRQETGEYVEPPRKKVRKTRRERDLKRRHRVGSEDSITSLSDWSTSERKVQWLGGKVPEKEDDNSDVSIPRTKDPFDDLRFVKISPDVITFEADSDIIEQDFEGEENAESIISPQYTRLPTAFEERPVVFRTVMYYPADRDRVKSRKVREQESRHRRAKRKSGKARKS